MLGLMIAGVAFVVWVTGTTVERFSLYHMYFEEGTVTGLQVGSAVRFRGIPVGEVTEINILFDEEAQMLEPRIEVVAEIGENTPVTENTRAVLELQGITGVSFVQLTAEAVPSPLLQPGEDGRRVIPTEPSQLSRIFESFPQLLAELTDLANKAADLLDDESRDNIKQTFANLEELTGNLADDSNRFGPLLAEAQEVLAQASVVMEQGSTLLERGGEVMDEIGPAVSTVGDAAEAFEDTMREVEVMVAANQQPIADFAATGLYEFSQLLIETRELISTLSRLSRRIESDPARFFFGDQQRGYDTQ